MTLTAMAGTHPVTRSLQAFSRPLEKSIGDDTAYRLLVFATNWGYTGTWEAFAGRIREAGYDGAEVWYPFDARQRGDMLSAFNDRGLKLGFLVGGSDPHFQKHLDQFTAGLEGAVAEKPVYINCHSGRDYFTFEQNQRFIDLTTRISASYAVPIYHETHRSRILYSAPVARQFIERLPDLRITLDISHWCNVHESLLDDQAQTISQTLQRVDHIHARIGHAEGPQVNDPRAPEWHDAVAAHFGWWDTVVTQKRQKGATMTFLTEFGPADYMPALPYTRQPVANQWEINQYMLDTLRKRYS